MTCTVGGVVSEMNSICIPAKLEFIIQEHSCSAPTFNLSLFAVVNALCRLLWCIKGLIKLLVVDLASLVAICQYLAHFCSCSFSSLLHISSMWGHSTASFTATMVLLAKRNMNIIYCSTVKPDSIHYFTFYSYSKKATFYIWCYDQCEDRTMKTWNK